MPLLLPIPRQWTIVRDSCTGNFSIASRQTPARYLVFHDSVACLSALSLHVSTGGRGPMLAASYNSTSLMPDEFNIAIGDPARPDLIENCETMVRTPRVLRVDQYSWATGLVAQGPPWHSRRSFTWKRTCTLTPAGETIPFWGPPRYKLVDGITHQVAAVYAGGRGSKSPGVLQINTPHLEEFDNLILITLISMLENKRNRHGAVPKCQALANFGAKLTTSVRVLAARASSRRASNSRDDPDSEALRRFEFSLLPGDVYA
ncbi:hypothetical protein HIM_00035 [Hirsutella minnesotensis 3608]|nr:hypothetical protein HIM_00035 [Hirsutella minnesotensis 3608]